MVAGPYFQNENQRINDKKERKKPAFCGYSTTKQ